MSFDVKETTKTGNIVLNKNDQFIEINGALDDEGTEANVKFIYSDTGSERVIADLQYAATAAGRNISAKLTSDDQVYEASGSVAFDSDLAVKVQVKTPFASYEQMDASFSTKQSNNSLRAAFIKNDDKFEIKGSLEHDYAGSLLTPNYLSNG